MGGVGKDEVGAWAHLLLHVVGVAQNLCRNVEGSGVRDGTDCRGRVAEAGRKLVSMLPRRRLGQAEDLDGLMLLLASDQSDFINGAVITADDGFAL